MPRERREGDAPYFQILLLSPEELVVELGVAVPLPKRDWRARREGRWVGVSSERCQGDGGGGIARRERGGGGGRRGGGGHPTGRGVQKDERFRFEKVERRERERARTSLSWFAATWDRSRTPLATPSSFSLVLKGSGVTQVRRAHEQRLQKNAGE